MGNAAGLFMLWAIFTASSLVFTILYTWRMQTTRQPLSVAIVQRDTFHIMLVSVCMLIVIGSFSLIQLPLNVHPLDYQLLAGGWLLIMGLLSILPWVVLIIALLIERRHPIRFMHTGPVAAFLGRWNARALSYNVTGGAALVGLIAIAFGFFAVVGIIDP